MCTYLSLSHKNYVIFYIDISLRIVCKLLLELLFCLPSNGIIANTLSFLEINI